MAGYTRVQWARQLYSVAAGLYPIGYLVMHGFRDMTYSNLYIHRSELKPSEQLKELVAQEFDRLEDVTFPKLMVTLTDRMEPSTYGAFFLRNGVELQLPAALSMVDIEYAHRLGGHVELDLGQARHRRKLEVTSELAVELLSQMLLSEPAKRFVIQRELQRANDGVLFVVPVAAWGMIACLLHPFHIRLARYIGPFVAMFAGLAVAIAAFRLLLESFDRFAILRCDEAAARLGPEYIEGARKFLANQLTVNRMIRKIMGEEGEKLVTKSGELNSASVSIRERLKAIERIAAQIKPSDTAAASSSSSHQPITDDV